MKKFIALVLQAFPSLIFGQSIVGNTYNGDDHIVITDKKVCRSFTDRMVLSVGLSGIRIKKDSKDIYFIDLKITSGEKITMTSGNHLIITLKNGDVIKLTAADDDTNGMVRDIHNVNGFITHDYSAYPSFVITAEQIESICSNGVKKVECHTSPNMYFKEFKKDHVGKAIAERWNILQQSLHPSESSTQDKTDADKPKSFPKLFGLNKGFSVGIIGGAMDNFNYGGIGVNATFYGVYLDFMGWSRKNVNDVHSQNWEELSVWSSHVGYQIPFHKYQDGSIRLIPMIGYYAKKEGAEFNIDDNTYRTTATTGEFDYGAALAFQNKDDKFGYFNFYIGATKHTAWIGLGVDISKNKMKGDEVEIPTKQSSRNISFGIIGGGIDHFNYGAIGFNASIYNFYLDFMGWPRIHGSDTGIDKWEDHWQYAFHAGYQIPVHPNIGIAPIIGYAKVKKGITDGSDWDITNSTINNSFHVSEERGGFDYGAVLILHTKQRKGRSFNFSIAYTRHTAYAGFGYGFTF